MGVFLPRMTVGCQQQFLPMASPMVRIKATQSLTITDLAVPPEIQLIVAMDSTTTAEAILIVTIISLASETTVTEALTVMTTTEAP